MGNFAPFRGGGRDAFGIVAWGGCGYTNSDGSLAFDQTRATAYSDVNVDGAGACGRCYEVRCRDGPVLGWEDQPVDYTQVGDERAMWCSGRYMSDLAGCWMPF